MICVSSVAGLRGRGKNFIYGSTKAALITFLSGCRNFLNDKNIFIMTVLPGFIKNNNYKKGIFENFLQIEPSVLAKKIYLAHKQKKKNSVLEFFVEINYVDYTNFTKQNF